MAGRSKRTERADNGDGETRAQPAQVADVVDMSIPGVRAPTREAFHKSRREVLPDVRAKAIARDGRGRAKYSDAMADALMVLLSNGMTLVQACDALGVGRSSIHQWLADGDARFDHLRSCFARGREASGEFMAGEALAVAREIAGKPDVTSAQVGAATLHVKTLMWYSTAMNRLFNQNAVRQLEVTGANGAPLGQPMVIDARSLPDDQREAVREALRALQAKQINQ